MKYIAKLFLFAALLSCGGTFVENVHENGVQVRSTKVEAGLLDVSRETTIYDPAMQSCLSELGKLPAHEEEKLCVERVRRDADRRHHQLDWYSYPYGYYPTP